MTKGEQKYIIWYTAEKGGYVRLGTLWSFWVSEDMSLQGFCLIVSSSVSESIFKLLPFRLFLGLGAVLETVLNLECFRLQWFKMFVTWMKCAFCMHLLHTSRTRASKHVLVVLSSVYCFTSCGPFVPTQQCHIRIFTFHQLFYFWIYFTDTLCISPLCCTQ